MEIGSQIHDPAALLPWESNHFVGTRSGLGFWDLRLLRKHYREFEADQPVIKGVLDAILQG
jgi:hypothetical protein